MRGAKGGAITAMQLGLERHKRILGWVTRRLMEKMEGDKRACFMSLRSGHEKHKTTMLWVTQRLTEAMIGAKRRTIEALRHNYDSALRNDLQTKLDSKRNGSKIDIQSLRIEDYPLSTIHDPRSMIHDP